MRIFITSSILFLFSCSVPKNDPQKVEYNWSEIILSSNDNGLSIDDCPYYFYNNQNAYYVNYNNLTHSLNYYNLSTKVFERKIQFYKSGASKIQGINEYTLAGDTVILYENLALRFFNQEGLLKKSLSLKEIQPWYNDLYSLEKKV